MIEYHEELFTRLVTAFELMAQALAGIDETKKREFEKQWPDRKVWREAVVTHVPTEEDLIRESQGASNEPIEEWIGIREKEFLEGQASDSGAGFDASSEAALQPESDKGDPEAPQDQA